MLAKSRKNTQSDCIRLGPRAFCMSEKPDNDLSLDLQFLPDWATDESSANKYANHSGEDRPQRGRRGDRNDRRPRRDDRRDRKDRPARDGRDDRRGKGGPRDRGRRDDRRKDSRRDGKPSRPLAPQLDLKVDFVPDAVGVESIAKEIRLTGRAYPLFQIALLVLDRPARYAVKLRTIRNNEGQPAQRLFACQLDDTAWLTESQAVRHVLSAHFDKFYETNKVEVEAPKGNFTFVAQCGITDEYLGPPNHHDYQNRIVKFHAERMPRMPFEKFKSRIRICREEEAVNAWLEQVKWKTEYTARNGDDAPKFDTRDEVEAHFREHHLAGTIAEVETHSFPGDAAKAMRDPRTLAEFLRDQWHRQKHFPMQVSTHLSKIFSSLGLQFFKKDKKVTHVAVAKPNYLDVESEPVSEGVKKVITFIESTAECTRRKILESHGGLKHVEPKEGEEPPPMPEQTEEQKQLIADLHWLIHQGHVLEFSNGIIETAKKSRKQVEAEEASDKTDTTETTAEPEVTNAEEPVAEQPTAES